MFLARQALGLIGLVFVGACTSTPDPIIGFAASEPVVGLGQAGFQYAQPSEYLMRPADAISISVFREPSFSLERVQIGPEGSISLPMIGPVSAASLTRVQFEAEVTRQLAALGLRNPQVSVNILEQDTGSTSTIGCKTKALHKPLQWEHSTC